jgi:hypothetical protein
MSSNSQTREVSHDPRDTIQAAPRKSSRIKNKQLMQSSKRSVSSKESKAPKVIKLSSSSEMSKLASIRTPKKESYKNDDESYHSDDNKSNASSKMSCWGSPDLSRGIEKLFKLIKINEDSKFLITPMDLDNVRNMIQLSGQDLHDITSLFSCQDLRDPNFQDSIIKILCLGKCFKLVLKEIHDLGEHDNIPIQLIPSTFSEENTFLDANNSKTSLHEMLCTVTQGITRPSRRLNDTRFIGAIYSQY